MRIEKPKEERQEGVKEEGGEESAEIYRSMFGLVGLRIAGIEEVKEGVIG